MSLCWFEFQVRVANNQTISLTSRCFFRAQIQGFAFLLSLSILLMTHYFPFHLHNASLNRSSVWILTDLQLARFLSEAMSILGTEVLCKLAHLAIEISQQHDHLLRRRPYGTYPWVFCVMDSSKLLFKETPGIRHSITGRTWIFCPFGEFGCRPSDLLTLRLTICKLKLCVALQFQCAGYRLYPSFLGSFIGVAWTHTESECDRSNATSDSQSDCLSLCLPQPVTTNASGRPPKIISRTLCLLSGGTFLWRLPHLVLVATSITKFEAWQKIFCLSRPPDMTPARNKVSPPVWQPPPTSIMWIKISNDCCE